MKKLLFFALFLLSFFGLQAQNNYLLSGSITGIEVTERGALLLNQIAIDTSFTTATEKLWFKSPSGFAGSGTVQAGPLNVALRNITNSPIKVSIYDFTKTTLIRTVNISPGYTEYWEYLEKKSLNAALDYYWKIESTTTQAPVIVADTKLIPADGFDVLTLLTNDQNLTTAMTARLKPLQTITGINVNYINPDGSTKITAGSTPGTYSFVYQVMNGVTIVGEATVTITVGLASQYCSMNITDMALKSGSTNIYVVNVYSAYANINPFNWEIRNISTGSIVRQGQTTVPDAPNREISFAGLPTATYRFVISSSTKTCSDVRDIAYVAATDACNISITNIDRVGVSNNYKVDVIYANTASYKYDANVTNYTNATGVTANTFTLNLDNRNAGTYTVRVDGEGGKICTNSATFNHTIIDPLASQKLETYVKFITGKTDNWEIRGTNSEASGRDYTTQWRIPDPKTNIVWQSYVSNWQNLGASLNALASIGFQKDTARNEPAIWLSVFDNRIELRQRIAKSGGVTTVNSATGVTFPVWLRLEKIGANITAKYSTSQSMFPVWTQLGTIINATPLATWTKLSKTLSVGSDKADVTATARFQGHLGGQVTFGTSVIVTPTTPTITKSIANPAQNDALTLTSSACVAGSVVKWYKNNTFVSAGNSLAIIAIHNDAYYARCENGTIRSDSSNVVRFIYGITTCDNNTLPFAINTISNISGNSYSAQFTAANLTFVNVDIRNSSNTSVRNYDTPVSANPLIIDAGTLTTGTYTLKLTGKSCVGNASKSFTVNAITPTLSCANNGTFSISSISQSDATLYNVTYNASNLSNVEAIVKNASNITVRTVTLSVNSNPTIVDIGTQPAGIYTLQFNGLSCLGSTTAKTFNVVNSNPSCNNGGSFSIASATYNNAGTLTFQFNAANLSTATWTVRQGTSIISSGVLSGITSSTNTVNTSTLSAGNYTLQLEGTSCNGIAIRQFTVGTVTTTPVLTSSIAAPVTGDNITLTATGCTGNYNFFKNLENAPFATTAGSTQISNVQSPDYYYVQCATGSLNSNYIQVNSVITNGGLTALAIAPSEIIIPTETEWNRFRPEIIPTVTLPTKLDPVTGLVLPDKWFIWHSPFRNMFGYVANQGVTDPVTRLNNELTGMRRLGFMAQLWNFTEPCYENTQTFTNGSSCTFTTTQTTLDVAKEVLSGENPLGVLGENPMDFAQRSYDDFIGGINYSRKPFINGKYQSLGYISDGENIYTGGQDQKDVNALTNAYYKIAADLRGYIGNQYFAPNNSLGYMSDNFFSGNSQMLSWHGTANAGTHTGKSLKNLNQVISIAEMGTFYEDMLPEGTVIKDQNNNNWFTISHFGTNVGVDIDYKKTGGANARHWAVQYGGITYKNAKDAHATGHKHLISLKLGNQIGNGYMYSPESATSHDGKYIKDYDLSMGPEYYNNPSITQTPNDTPLPPYMAEGTVLLSMFEGADGIYLWNSAWNKVLYPITKTGNPRNHEHQIDPTLDRVPRDFYTYYLKGQSRLGQKYSFSDATNYSFLDLVAETDTRYLLDQTEYSIDGGITYVKVIPLEWSRQRLPPVLMVVNDRLHKAFIYAQEAYNECSSRNITSVKVRYGGKVYDVPILPNNKPNLVGYLLSATPITNGGNVTAPVITANPTNPVAGTSVTFSTSSQCAGTIKWYNADAQMSTGISYTVANPVANNSYTATCTVSGISSAASNVITIAAANTGGVTITEPAKPQYYYSDGHAPAYYANRANLPAIITNSATFDEADVIKLKNSEIEVWFNPKRGGQICYASKANVAVNRVYNGYDGGFQWVYDGTQHLVDGKLNGASPDQTNNNADYNTTMGGDFQNHSQTLIDYHATTNGYYFKFRPILYNFISRFSEVEIEVTYTLVGKSLKAQYTYTSFRTDANIETNNPFRFKGFDIPICFLTNNFTKYALYTGSSPWTNGALTEGDIPNTTAGAASSLGFNSKEYAGMVYDPATNFSVGVLNNSEGGTEATVTYEQLNKYSGSSAGTVFTGPYTVMKLSASFAIPNGANYTRNSTVYFTLGDTKEEVRTELNTKAGH